MECPNNNVRYVVVAEGITILVYGPYVKNVW